MSQPKTAIGIAIQRRDALASNRDNLRIQVRDLLRSMDAIDSEILELNSTIFRAPIEHLQYLVQEGLLSCASVPNSPAPYKTCDCYACTYAREVQTTLSEIKQ